MHSYARGKRNRGKDVPGIGKPAKKRYVTEFSLFVIWIWRLWLRFLCYRQRPLEFEEYSADQVKTAESYMRTNPLDSASKSNNNRGQMLESFRITRKSRREFMNSKKQVSSTLLLKKYPRLRDMPEAVFTFPYHHRESNCIFWFFRWKTSFIFWRSLQLKYSLTILKMYRRKLWNTQKRL